MGKKNKKDKKGKGMEKTALKTEKKAEKRAKKELAEKGEEDIEKLIKEFQEQDKKRTQVVEEKCPPPSPRSNMTFTPHPDKDELMMFGGEFCTGNKIYLYNDLFFYHIKKSEWTKVTAPNAPPPRSSHQAVALRQDGGQLWIFGGEFASPTQSQFYHYKDLWVYHLKGKIWQEIRAPGGPSSRSGHRMVHCKKQLIVFGGFHDNVRDYKYFNDVYAFNLVTYTWSKLETSGTGPSPRSGFIMTALHDQPKVLVYGGYSKERIKKDVDKGTMHTDMYMLMPEGKTKTKEEDESQPVKWKWSLVKQSGNPPSPRCGMSLATMTGNKSLVFGGVFDQEEDDEQIEGVFYNDLYSLDLEKGKWFDVVLRGKKPAIEKKKRRKKNAVGQGDENEGQGQDDENEDEEMEESDEEEMENGVEETQEDIKKLQIDKMDTDEETPEQCNNDNGSSDVDNESSNVEDTSPNVDDVFKVTVGPQASTSQGSSANMSGESAMDIDTKMFKPSRRFGTLMVVKDSVLYLYGGTCEAGDKQLTYSDFYSLDVHKFDEWNMLIQPDEKMQIWDESDSSDDEEMAATGGKDTVKDEDRDESDEEDSDDEDIEEILEGCDVPSKLEVENIKTYFERTKAFWVEQSGKYFQNENMKVSKKTIEKFAKEMCQEYYSVKFKDK